MSGNGEAETTRLAAISIEEEENRENNNNNNNMRRSKWIVMTSVAITVILAISFLTYGLMVNKNNKSLENVDEDSFRVSASFEQQDIVIQRQASGLQDHQGRYLHEVEGDLMISVDIENLENFPVLISVHQTPLSDREVSSNFFASDQYLFHTGIIREDVGEFDEFVLLNPGDVLSHVTNFSSTTQIVYESDVDEVRSCVLNTLTTQSITHILTNKQVQTELDFELRVFSPERNDVKHLKIQQVTENTARIVRTDPIIIEGNETTRRRTSERRKLSSSIAFTTASDTYRGVRCVRALLRECQSNHLENHSNIQSTHTQNDRNIRFLTGITYVLMSPQIKLVIATPTDNLHRVQLCVRIALPFQLCVRRRVMHVVILVIDGRSLTNVKISRSHLSARVPRDRN